MDSSSPKLPLLLFNMALVLIAIGAGWFIFNSSLDNVSGEYFSSGEKLGNMRLSLKKNAHDLTGLLDYADGTTLELVPEYSSLQANNSLQLTFEVPKSQLRRYRPHHITFKGNYADNTISGTIEDLGGIYPTTFQRNPFASVIRNFIH